MSRRLAAIPWELVAIVLLAAGLRFWDLGRVGLIGDESYYWLWSEHLAPSYFDHPAGVAWMVRVSTLLGGSSEAGIRWLNAALGIGAVVLVYALAARLFSRRVGAASALLVAAGAPYVVTGRFVYTDALQLFLLLLNLWFLVPFLGDTRVAPTKAGGYPPKLRAPTELPRYRDRQFWAVGLSMAALLNAKYSAYLYALAVVVLLVGTRRELLRDRRTWWAAGLALAGLLPAVGWNAAYGWVSFRWQLQHLVSGAIGRPTLLGSLAHTADYLSPPLALLALLGATQLRSARQRLLWLPGVALVIPVVLSAADSPRNLTTGAVLLLILAVAAIVGLTGSPGRGQRRFPPAVSWTALAVFVLAAVLWGVGTLRETLAPTAWPHSAVATDIRRDGAGWRQAGRLGLDPQVPVFAVDYSVASQLRYYTGLPVQTSWGQYRLWGVPDLRTVQVLSLSYVDPVAIAGRLHQDCAEVSGPTEYDLGEGKVLRLWQARGCTVGAETFLDHLDLLNLLRAGGGP
jgi:4-amino-4-deoxy-L-arabinose transferase-like glycosyltransferase